MSRLAVWFLLSFAGALNGVFYWLYPVVSTDWLAGIGLVVTALGIGRFGGSAPIATLSSALGVAGLGSLITGASNVIGAADYPDEIGAYVALSVGALEIVAGGCLVSWALSTRPASATPLK